MNKSETIEALADALSKAQGEIEDASKDSTNPAFKSKYADLASVLSSIRPVFAKHGLSLTQCPSYNHETKLVEVTTLLMHKSGQWIESTLSSPLSKSDAQGIGSALTYCRRYAAAAVAGIGQEDDDGNAASSKSGRDTGKPASYGKPEGGDYSRQQFSKPGSQPEPARSPAPAAPAPAAAPPPRSTAVDDGALKELNAAWKRLEDTLEAVMGMDLADRKDAIATAKTRFRKEIEAEHPGLDDNGKIQRMRDKVETEILKLAPDTDNSGLGLGD